METIAQTWAHHIHESDFKKLPGDVVTKTKLIILDSIGAILAGSQADSSRIARSVVLARGGNPEASIIGFGDKTSCLSSGLVNGVMAHCMEIDDEHRPSDNHVAGVVVSGALTSADYTKCSGPELLTAVVLGYDIMGKIGESILLPRLPRPYFHNTGTCGPFGAAAAAGKLLGLTEEQLVNCIGIAGTQGAGLREVRVGGTYCKAFHAGKAVESGLLAAFLAESGFTGPSTVIEGFEGFCKAFSSQPRPELSTEGIGSRFEVMRSTLKRYAAVGGSHSAIDATLRIVDENEINPVEIENILVAVTTDQASSPLHNNSDPSTQLSAQLSIPYAVAVTILDDEALVKQFSKQRIDSQDVKEMLKKVRVEADAEADESARRDASDPNYIPLATVHIRMKDGKQYRSQTNQPKGFSIKNQMSEDEVKQKFRRVTEEILANSHAERIIEMIMQLERIDNASDIIQSTLLKRS
jgi:2-methylcitrate dehydratase PrpD